MNVGFVGVGSWAERLKAAFEKCGTKIVAHDRQGAAPAPGFGELRKLKDMLKDPSIGAVVSAAPPEVTTRVAREAMAARMPAFLTKPLLLDENIGLRATLYVDYVRLASPIYERIKFRAAERGIKHVSIRMYGNGPVRSFPGALDYGPHAIAFLCDLLGAGCTTWNFESRALALEPDGRELYLVDGRCKGVPFSLITGNGARTGQRRLTVTHDDGRVSEYVEERGEARLVLDGQIVDFACHQDALTELVRWFLLHAESKVIETKWLGISMTAQDVLRRIRSGALRDP